MSTGTRKLLVFTGGGTGGHVYPGLAIIDELKKEGRISSEDILWIGSGKGMEGEILKKHGIPFFSVPSGKLRRYFSFKNVTDLFLIALALCKSLVFMLKYRPVLLFSKGGYVSVPPVIAARICRVPVLTHESDLDPGLATRLNARFADRICISYDKTREYFTSSVAGKLVLTGNPVRPAMLEGDPEIGRRSFGLPGNKPLVLVIGGSLGAQQINLLMAEVIDDILPHAEVLHQTGGGNGSDSPRPGYVRREYIHEEMPHVLAAADVVISRAGAGTLWECGTLGKAMLLIPLGMEGSRGDQLRNAAFFAEQGAARILSGDEASAGFLRKDVLELVSSQETRLRMGEAARRICGLNAAQSCGDLIMKIYGETVLHR
ncbi:undecaprenyldiphospho-muramoylpentapeptide beta-N-acetylglucosaminyltransferase [Marispirochaeta aestuarii]|uniref:undecaprenyldiphospho-muramoylpentapeptide beta-N-acetylglucosaminyltransferase n=1 Tax=Marispirochaeta aestuarii TaxID=1963862 RepID=UPI0029C78331|nr:undecaprenyldiphospho-muramoylpentapeptide beta-N-acetylglucosaminyltransferase [Marispirochaeta aestuarii]